MKFVNSLTGADRQAAVLCAFKGIAESGQYSEGAYVFKLERLFGSFMRGQAAVAVNSRGSALYTAFRYYASVGHKYVAIQNNTFYAVAAMALEAGLKVFLVDSSPNCPSMGVDSLRTVINSNPSIRLAVMNHVGGFVAKEHSDLQQLCDEKQVALMEDCSSVIGVDDEYLRPGMLSDSSIWSFQPGSAVPVGGGSLIVTSNMALRNYAKLFRAYGKHIDNGIVRYGSGMDLRMSEWEASIACVQLEALPTILDARKRDAFALQSIAPCLLDGACNYQSYPVDPVYASKKVHAPAIHALTEQLSHALPSKDFVATNLVHSARWAHGHKCLPLGEGVYDGMGSKEILASLNRELRHL